MALGMRCGPIEMAANGGSGFLTRTRSFGMKRTILTNYMFVYYDCGVKTPAKKHCVENFDFGQEKSILEALPQDILIRVLCGVDHDDLKRLFHVSKPIRDATLIAKKWHFGYSTPKKVLRFWNSIHLEDAVFDEVEAPNAPKQNRGPRSRLSKKKLGDISVALFAAEDDIGGWPRRDLLWKWRLRYRHSFVQLI